MASAIIGTTRFRLYEATLPLVHSVTTSAENGKITDSNLEIDEGGSYTVFYGCDTDHRLQSLLIDGEAVDVSQYPLSYTFTDLQEDRTAYYNEAQHDRNTGLYRLYLSYQRNHRYLPIRERA